MTSITDMKKIEITEEQHCSISELAGNLPEIINWLEELAIQGWEFMDIEYDCDDSPEIVFSRFREETDKEFQKRKKQLQKNKQIKKDVKAEQAKKELALYQKLKQKYETV